jgi:hypothetical protein
MRLLPVRRTRTRVLVLAASALALVSAVLVTAIARADTSDYTQSITEVTGAQDQISFTPTTPASLVDVHYLLNGANQQNFRMTNNNGTWQQTIGSLTAGTVIEYWFTYEKNGPLFDSIHYTHTQGGGSGTVATPTFGPAAGTYTTTQMVTITTSTAGATIRYTTDGSTPTATSTLYSGPVTVASSLTLKAIGIKSGLANSAVATASYTISSGSAEFTQSVSATDSSHALFSFHSNVGSAWADIHYTVNSGPQQNIRMTFNGATGNWEYTLAGLVSGNVVGYWFTYEKAGVAVDTGTFSYTFSSGGSGAVAAPTFSPAGGTYTSAQSVTITTTTAGAAIHYTTDGSTPTASSPLYSGPITVSATTTVKAIGTKSGLTDSAVATAVYTIGGGGGGGTGTFPVTFQNNTRSVWTNSQLYVTFLGQVTPGQWSYLKPDGTVTHINHLDATAPNHLTKNGVNYANMSFTLAQASTVTFPSHIEGGRIYLSINSPMYIPISPDDAGWGGPDLLNPNDPNANVYFDWYELGYIFGVTGFGGNTTQVDQFGFPMTARLQQTSTGYDQTVGITQTRDQVFAGYQSSVGTAFQGLSNTYRIVAPRSSAAFQPGGAQASYMQAYIDQVWNYYTTNTWTLNDLGQSYTGHVVNGVLTGTKNNGASFSVPKPTTADVFMCAGALAVPNNLGGNDTTREVGRDFCAAFNRGVALNPNTADWFTASKYYLTNPKNDYAKYVHSISIDNRSYAFAYDDVNDQSSVKILGNSNAPSLLTIGIGW